MYLYANLKAINALKGSTDESQSLKREILAERSHKSTTLLVAFGSG